jgi:hypothetical protein
MEGYKQDILWRTNRLLSFDMLWTTYKMTPPKILLCRRNVFTELLPSNGKGKHRPTHRHTRPTIYLSLGVFVASGTCLSSRCLAKRRSVCLTTMKRTHIQTHRLMGGIYKVRCWDGLRSHAIFTNFHKDRFWHSKVMGGDSQTHGHSTW